MPGIAPRRQLYPQQEKISARLKELPLSAKCRLMRCSRVPENSVHFITRPAAAPAQAEQLRSLSS